MQLCSKIRQYYRFFRNLKKIHSVRSRAAKEQHLAAQMRFYSQFIRPGELCFDIGANIGDKTEVFLRLGAKVVAVEPQESCWRILKRRFKNDCVYIEPVVLADAEGEKNLYVDKSPTVSSMSKEWIAAVKKSGRFSRSHKWSYSVNVRATTLDKLIEKYGMPVFCKIDVEGAEEDVLKGLSKPVKCLSFEFISERKNAIANCINILTGTGTYLFNYCISKSMAFEKQKWLSIAEMQAELGKIDTKLTNFGDIYCKSII